MPKDSPIAFSSLTFLPLKAPPPGLRGAARGMMGRLGGRLGWARRREAWGIARCAGRFARATPAKAVGLLLLPVINLYWMFQAYWGWTKDFNRFAHSRYLRVQPMPEEIALLACVMSLVPIPAALLFSGLPDPRFSIILGWMATMVEMALTAYLFWRACDGINAVARLYAAAAAGVPHQAPNGAVP